MLSLPPTQKIAVNNASPETVPFVVVSCRALSRLATIERWTERPPSVTLLRAPRLRPRGLAASVLRGPLLRSLHFLLADRALQS